MAANSTLRRALKRFLHPLLSERFYIYLQSLAMAWDIRAGNYPEPELELIPRAVRQGETVLDIGANYGFYTYHLSRAVGRKGIVYAFEPVPFTNRVLQIVGKFLRFPSVQIIAKGCSDRTGNVEFNVPVQNSGAISAGLAYMSVYPDKDQQETTGRTADDQRLIRCELIRVDDFLPPLSELSFIKCDIEGTELLALRGAEATISRHHPTILCEINYRFLARANIGLQELEEFFSSKGYEMYQWDKESRRLVKIPAMENNIEGNYIFVHPDRSNRFADLL